MITNYKALNSKLKFNILLPTLLGLIAVGGLGALAYSLLSSINPLARTTYIYIDADDNLDSLYHKTTQVGIHCPTTFRWLTQTNLFNLKTGKYAISENCNALTYFKTLRSGLQTPVKLIIPSVWNIEQISARIAKQLMLDSATLMKCITDSTTLMKFNCNYEALPALFIPNTYEVWWNISPQQFVNRLHREYTTFWNSTRKAKATSLGLTPFEVTTLASIVCRETNNTAEMPTIAGLYYNRLKRKLPLQACPTVIFARGDFSITRLTNPMEPDSPYNTYRYPGLPPGPIFIPPIVAIDAVLNLQQHNYLYMCAKEDFSGTHRFASTYSEHQRNAKIYQRAYKKRFGKKL